MLPGFAQFFEQEQAAPLPYDAEVEYLESTGTQWIITGTKPNVGDIYAVDATVQYAQDVVSNTWLTGWWMNSLCSSLFGTYQNQIYFTYNVDNNIAKTSSGLTEKHRIRYNFPSGIYIDDTLLSSGVAANTPLSVIPSSSVFTGLSIFRAFASGSYHGDTNIKAKLFNFSILINGNVVFNGIPVRFTNELGQSEGAMYDRANPTVGMNPDGSARTDGLYRNRGTGAFVLPS